MVDYGLDIEDLELEDIQEDEDRITPLLPINYHIDMNWNEITPSVNLSLKDVQDTLLISIHNLNKIFDSK